jgi:nucleotide-binding universal stress UspA family protein
MEVAGFMASAGAGEMSRNQEEAEMKMIEKIVVPVDFAENTDKLVAYACAMAEKFAAAIHFLHVVAAYPGDVMIGAPFAEEYRDRIIFAAEERMRNLVDDCNARGRVCTGLVVGGEPVEKIVELAAAAGADLIVISTHGAKGLEKILLGSVAERVLKRAHCPVLIMNPFKKLKA